MRDKGISASLAWGSLSQAGLEQPQEPGEEIPGSPGRSAAGCGGRGRLLMMSHAGALQDAVCGSRGDAEREREEGQSGRKW